MKHCHQIREICTHILTTFGLLAFKDEDSQWSYKRRLKPITRNLVTSDQVTMKRSNPQPPQKSLPTSFPGEILLVLKPTRRKGDTHGLKVIVKVIPEQSLW